MVCSLRLLKRAPRTFIHTIRI